MLKRRGIQHQLLSQVRRKQSGITLHTSPSIYSSIVPPHALSVLNTIILRNSAHSFSAQMGLILGKIKVETPKYEVIQSTADYEIRKYPPAVIAEVTYDPSQFKGNKDGGFNLLASYIGVFGNPQNTKPEKINMTSPVITKSSSEKIDMTSPVVTKEGDNKLVTMQFILPSKYSKAEDAPKPVDDRVVIKEEGENKYGVVQFSGVASDNVVKVKVEELNKSLERDGFEIIGDFVLARYNPPWTLPPFRRNEVMIPLE